MDYLPLSVYSLSICTRACRHRLMRRLFTSHWSVTGNEKSKGEICNYPDIQEPEGEENKPYMTPWLIWYIACTCIHPHALSDAKRKKKHQPDATATNRKLSFTPVNTDCCTPAPGYSAGIYIQKKINYKKLLHRAERQKKRLSRLVCSATNYAAKYKSP